jgi:homoserine O-acetyltransferase
LLQTIFHFQENFKFESGQDVTGLYLSYQTFGKLNDKKDNVIWVVHALSANANPLEWWPGVVGETFAIDPKEYFIICVNNPGSHYGSFSPLSINAATSEPYFHTFPIFTPRDIAYAFDKLRSHLGLNHIKILIGASIGGQIALEWAIINPKTFEELILIATAAKSSPWLIAFNQSQRLAIEADHTWKERHIDAGKAGLKAARSIALLSYRTPQGYNQTQQDLNNKIDDFSAATYQNYQGEKLVKRFNAFSYYTITKTMDSHNVSRGRQSFEGALSKIKANTTIIGISTDLLFPTNEQIFLAKHIQNARYIEIFSELGHDGFLTESKQVGKIIEEVLSVNKVIA